MRFGYFLSSEEHGPNELVEQAQRAADAGLDEILISDHYHPWMDRQGHSPFVWSVIGAIEAKTNQTITTGVTCPTIRIHPAVMAQATATAAVMTEGRFRFGVGSGENLNEHVVGADWPETDVRLEMLEEAIRVIRELWKGETVSHRGLHYTVRNARLYDIPDEPPPVVISGFGPKATRLAGQIGDGFITTHPDKELVDLFFNSGGEGKLTMGGMKVCFGDDAEACRKRVHELWRSSAVPGEASQELPSPAHFEQVSQLVTVEAAADGTPCGNDPSEYVDAIRSYQDAGIDILFVNQIGEGQQDFLDFFNAEVREAVSTPDRQPVGV